MGSGESSEGTGGGVERPRLLSFVRPEQVPDRVGDWEVGVGWCQSASPITLGTGVWVLGEARAGPRSEAGTGIGARFPRRGAGWVVFVWFLRGDRTFETVSYESVSLGGRGNAHRAAGRDVHRHGVGECCAGVDCLHQ